MEGFPGGASGKEPACQPVQVTEETPVWPVDQEETPGGGHGNPVQYSCLRNPMDRGAWWLTNSPHCTAEMTTTLQSNYTSLPDKIPLKKKKRMSMMHFWGRLTRVKSTLAIGENDCSWQPYDRWDEIRIKLRKTFITRKYVLVIAS